MQENVDFKKVSVVISDHCLFLCSGDINCKAYEFNTSDNSCLHWFGTIKGDGTANINYSCKMKKDGAEPIPLHYYKTENGHCVRSDGENA